MTTARVGGIHQSTLIFHKLKKVSPCPRQLFPEIFRRNFQQWRSYGRFQDKDCPQYENNSLLSVHTKQHATHAFIPGIINQIAVNDLFFNTHFFRCMRIIEKITQLFKGGCFQPPLIALDKMIENYTVQPCSETAFALELA